jgi:hypothetical protein
MIKLMVSFLFILLLAASCGGNILGETALPPEPVEVQPDDSDEEEPAEEEDPEEETEPEPEEEDPEEAEPEEPEPDPFMGVTFLLYMNGDNDLEDALISDLTEIENCPISLEQIRIIILADGLHSYPTRLLELTENDSGQSNSALTQITDAPFCPPGAELNLGNPEILRAFVKTGMQRHPAAEYGLILWGNGSGIRSFCPDSSSGGESLDAAEISRALAGLNPGLIIFDTSYAGMIEAAYELERVTRIMAAPEGRMPSEGIPYGTFFSRLSSSEDLSPRNIGTIVTEVCLGQYISYPGFSYGAFDLTVIGTVMDCLNVFSDKLYSLCGNSGNRNRIKHLLFHETWGFYEIPGDLNIDITHAAHLLSEEFSELSEPARQLIDSVNAGLIAGGCNNGMPPLIGNLAIHLIPLSSSGFPLTHHPEYFQNRPVDIPLAFVSDSSWVPCYPEGPGFLYRLWYEFF